MNLEKIVKSQIFEKIIVITILINAVSLGLDTVSFENILYTKITNLVNSICMAIFVLELLLKLIVFKNNFFKDAWNNFDFLIIAISFIPSIGPFSVIRALRVLRIAKIIRVNKAFAQVIDGLFRAIPGLGAVTGVIGLVFYIGAVMATHLFGRNFPDWFGTVGESSYSLFQIMTLESWSMGIVRPVMKIYPYAWLFFVPFILITTFTTLNLFIAVIVDAMEDSESEEAASNRELTSHDERARILEEVLALRARLEK